MLKRSARKDQAFTTSKETINHKQIEQIVATWLPEHQDERTTEQLKQENRELRAFILGMSFSQAQGLSEIKQRLQQFEQGEVQRDRQLLKRVELIRNVVMFTKRQVSNAKSMISAIHKYTKPALYATLSATLLGDVVADLGKEVVKKMFGEETFESWATGIISILKSIEPLYRLYVEGISFVFPMLAPKTATIVIMVAALILNHAVSIWQSTRNGLEEK